METDRQQMNENDKCEEGKVSTLAKPVYDTFVDTEGSEQCREEKLIQGENGFLIRELADLPEKTILDEKRLAAFLGVTPRTVRRMVARHELPPPMPFAGRSTWFVGRILSHLESSAERVAKESEREQARIRKLSP